MRLRFRVLEYSREYCLSGCSLSVEYGREYVPRARLPCSTNQYTPWTMRALRQPTFRKLAFGQPLRPLLVSPRLRAWCSCSNEHTRRVERAELNQARQEGLISVQEYLSELRKLSSTTTSQGQGAASGAGSSSDIATSSHALMPLQLGMHMVTTTIDQKKKMMNILDAECGTIHLHRPLPPTPNSAREAHRLGDSCGDSGESVVGGLSRVRSSDM